jgi:hypothetical protein
MAARKGVKYDGGKERAHLVLTGFSRALLEVAWVGTQGALKYAEDDWLYVENGFARYSDAMMRHILKERKSKHDEESGLLHAAHIAWNALARLELGLRALEASGNEKARRCVPPGRTNG